MTHLKMDVRCDRIFEALVVLCFYELSQCYRTRVKIAGPVTVIPTKKKKKKKKQQ
jgi:hypothetical protein